MRASLKLTSMGSVNAGSCNVAVVVSGQGHFGDGLAPYTRPENEFVAPYGSFTAAHFALTAQRYLHELGPQGAVQARADVAELAATIRTCGSKNPEAVLTDRGVITAADVVASRPIASPLHLLDICLANEGAVAIIVANEAVARGCPDPVEILGVGCVWQRQQYTMAARFDENWRVGEGAAFAVEAGIGPDGAMPTNTDGGLLSYSHTGFGGTHTRAAYAIRQIRGTAGAGQVADVETAVACGAGSGAQYHSTVVFGRSR
jgi:acetyl-CoA acetyltransferase